MKNPFKDLTKFELFLWLFSLLLVSGGFLLAPEKDYLTLVASLIGATALIFVSKGYVLGQILTLVFALFYGIVSFFFHYYGEMITYLCMTAPIALASTISWLKHPYKRTKEVTVARITGKQVLILAILTVAVTAAFYFILRALGNANLIVSTLSVATSFVASSLTLLRSPYYAIGYAANDVVLIILWVLASIQNPAYIPMILCFVVFLLNDLYGFINWKRIQKRQN